MEIRYYLYQVHTTCTFLTPTTLASTMYWALIQFLQRNYIAAFKLIESCSLDTPFSPEEKWIYQQFDRADFDQHPNAHACRLKLLLGMLFSSNPVLFKKKSQKLIF